MQLLMVILLFIIATAVAPQAMLNICAFVEAIFKILWRIVAFAACISFWWYLAVR